MCVCIFLVSFVFDLSPFFCFLSFSFLLYFTFSLSFVFYLSSVFFFPTNVRHVSLLLVLTTSLLRTAFFVFFINTYAFVRVYMGGVLNVRACVRACVCEYAHTRAHAHTRACALSLSLTHAQAQTCACTRISCRLFMA